MVILIASDKTRVRRGLADRLREKTPHRVLTAASVAEMETLPEMEGALDLLVFSPVFSEPGKEARARLRLRFPGLQTVVLDDRIPLEQSLKTLMEWVGPEPEADALTDGAEPGGDAAPGERASEEGNFDRVSLSVPPTADPEGTFDFTESPVETPPVSEEREEGGDRRDRGLGREGLEDFSNLETAPGSLDGERAPVVQGDYELGELVQSTEITLIYKAVQQSVRRTVAFECLRPELAADKVAAKQFRQLVRARALVSHPVIASVYEAKESGEAIFHTFELLPGENLPALVAAGRHFPQSVLLSLLQAGADALVWMDEHGIPHESVRPEHFFIGPNGTSRILNLASHSSPVPDTTAGSLAQLAAVCQRLAEPRSAQTRELAHVLGLMRSPGPHGIHSWKTLLKETRNSLQRLTEAHTAISPESPDRVLARRRGQKQLLIWVAGILSLAAAGTWLTTSWLSASRAKARNLEGRVKVAGGPFIFRDGQQVDLPDFWIDRYEVTLWQYSNFLDALKEGPLNRFDHPDQPAAKSGHQPPDWTEIRKAAGKGSAWHGHPLTLNCPVFNVDWWDAWAFAQWKGCRLPTEQEWEKAARGTDGRLWPWGMEADPKKANTGSDYAEQSGAGGGADGHSWWCDVDAMPSDRSPEEVIGMAGNVAEWTATLVPDPDFPDVEVPVFRGGDFHQTLPVPLNAGPWLAKGALYAQPFLGFRTASSKEAP